MPASKVKRSKMTGCPICGAEIAKRGLPVCVNGHQLDPAILNSVYPDDRPRNFDRVMPLPGADDLE